MDDRCDACSDGSTAGLQLGKKSPTNAVMLILVIVLVVAGPVLDESYSLI